MLRALRKHQAAGVVMHKIDRSARNFADWAKIVDLADAGIDVHFASESLDFRSRGGRLSADIQAVIAADYIRNLREETIKGITGRLAQGIYPFRAPIGYVDNGGGKPKTPDPVMAPMVCKAFELYASGQHSLLSLRSELKRLGLRNGYGKPLSKCGVETILNNPFYCGLIRIKRTGAVYRGVHEAIIPLALFDRVQRIKAGKSGKKVTKHNHTYRGLFRCANCDAAMTPERQKGHVYYRCQTSDCPTKCVREEDLERSIRGMLAKMTLTEEQIAVAACRIDGWLEANGGKEAMKAVELQRSQLDARLDALIDALIDRAIDNETYNRRKERLLMERTMLDVRRDELRERRDEPRTVRTFLELVKNLADNYGSALPAEKRQIVESAISNRRLRQKSLGLEPADWLLETKNAVAGLAGVHSRDTSRTAKRLEKHVQALIDVSKGKEADGLRSALHPDNENQPEIPQWRYSLKQQRPNDLSAAA
jgi:hypothetical protein